MTGLSLRRTHSAAPKTAAVKVTGGGSPSVCYVTINGEEVVRAGTYEVTPGDIVPCYASNRYAGYDGLIVLNGDRVASGHPAQFEYTVTKNATIDLVSYEDPAYDRSLWKIVISEE